MQKFKKSSVVLYINIIFSSILILAAIICFTKMGETTVHLGIDLYLIFGIVFLLFAIRFIYNLIVYFLLPIIVLTINKDEFIVHKRKKDIKIEASDLLGASKVQTFNFLYGMDVGTLKILLRDDLPIYIKYINDVDKAYQTLNILIVRNFENYHKENSSRFNSYRR